MTISGIRSALSTVASSSSRNDAARRLVRPPPPRRSRHPPSIRETCCNRSWSAFGITSGSNIDTRSMSTGNDVGDETSAGRLRIAVVGGGAAGMTSALHLSPLVAAGLVQGPIDVYESTVVKKKCRKEKINGMPGRSEGGRSGRNEGGRQSYPGSGAVGRDIGVGIWSTAWWPFLRSVREGLLSSASDEGGDSPGDDETTMADAVRRQKNRQSYQILLQDLDACGSYVKDVGYRTPNGGWLVKSELNASPFGIMDLLGSSEDVGDSAKKLDGEDPALLFVREKDLLSCLRNAIKIEQRLGMVKYHSGVRVDGIENVDGDLGSLALRTTANASEDTSDESETDPSLSPQYHLIIAADGLYSSSRSRFAGHHSIHATGPGIEAARSRNTLEYQWEHSEGQREATQVEDREYIVFRGNAPKLESNEEDGSGSFQTWGEERSMRFAAVPFRHETEDLEHDDDATINSSHYSQTQSFISKKQDEEVWFATIYDPAFVDAFKSTAEAPDAIEQKKLLLEAFGSWHRPVKTLIESTPAEKIMHEVAVAHRYNAPPVFDVARIMEFEMWQGWMEAKEGVRKSSVPDMRTDERIKGRGPILAFVGDSFMTVDPVLAQGFTIAMEGGGSIADSIERILVHPGATSSSCPIYDPKLLREELLQRHHSRERRLLQLLRSTELVQLLAQPHGYIGSFLATCVVRPMVKLCPEVVKRRVFDFVIRYSLGLPGGVGGVSSRKR